MVFLTEERILQPAAPWSSIARETSAKKDSDPLSEWKSSFNAWRTEIMKLRAFEQEDFFSDTASPVFSRMHRGWLCDLISKGELLGVWMLRQGGGSEEAKAELSHLDAFLFELRCALDTWHSLGRDPGAPNPLDQFFE
jgi:hypothetical protein